MIRNKNFGVYVVMAVALVAVLVIGISGTTLTGNAVRAKGACSDDDPRNHIHQYGEVRFEHREGTDIWPDECLSDDKHLKQYLCSRPNRLTSITHFCPKGCSEGVCLK